MLTVTCAIILVEDKILVTQRSEKMKLPLKWEFPGGKLEENETSEHCIKREIEEEINIQIEITDRLTPAVHNYGAFEIQLIPFLSKYVSGTIKLAEHKDYKLLEKSELVHLDWAEADLPIVEEFLKLEL